jgi:TolB protein
MTPQQITSIIKDDLNRSGYFKIIEAGAVITETSPVNFDEWKKRGAEALVVGSVQRLADGRFDVRYKLLDTMKSASLSGFSVAATPENTRKTAHKIADDIYEKLTGVRGAFSTRIAYVTKPGASIDLKLLMLTAKVSALHCVPMNRLFHHHGRRMAPRSPTCRLKRKNL